MISLISKYLDNPDKLKKFNDIIEMAHSLTEKKRFYMSTYGYSYEWDGYQAYYWPGATRNTYISFSYSF